MLTSAVFERHDTLLGLWLQQSVTLASEDVGDTGFPVTLAEETLSKVGLGLVVAFAVGAAAEGVARNDAPRWPAASSDNPGHPRKRNPRGQQRRSPATRYCQAVRRESDDAELIDVPRNTRGATPRGAGPSPVSPLRPSRADAGHSGRVHSATMAIDPGASCSSCLNQAELIPSPCAPTMSALRKSPT